MDGLTVEGMAGVIVSPLLSYVESLPPGPVPDILQGLSDGIELNIREALARHSDIPTGQVPAAG